MPAKTFTFRKYYTFDNFISFIHALKSYRASAWTFQMPLVHVLDLNGTLTSTIKYICVSNTDHVLRKPLFN